MHLVRTYHSNERNGERERKLSIEGKAFFRVSNFVTATILTRSFRYFRSLRFLIFYETIDAILFSSFLSFFSTDDRIKVDKVQFVSKYIFVLSLSPFRRYYIEFLLFKMAYEKNTNETRTKKKNKREKKKEKKSKGKRDLSSEA